MIQKPYYYMMQIKLNQAQLERVHEEIYGFAKNDSPICIQLEKLDKYIQERSGKGFKVDTFDTFDCGI